MPSLCIPYHLLETSLQRGNAGIFIQGTCVLQPFKKNIGFLKPKFWENHFLKTLEKHVNPHIVNMKFHKVTRVKYILKKKPVWLRHPLSTKSSCYNGGHILFQHIKPLGWLSIFIDIFVISAQKKK